MYPFSVIVVVLRLSIRYVCGENIDNGTMSARGVAQTSELRIDALVSSLLAFPDL